MNFTLFPSELSDSLVKFSSLLVIEATQLLGLEKSISTHTHPIINKDICWTFFQPNICLDGELSWCQYGLLKLHFLFLAKERQSLLRWRILLPMESFKRECSHWSWRRGFSLRLMPSAFQGLVSSAVFTSVSSHQRVDSYKVQCME